jgi:ribonuclease HI
MEQIIKENGLRFFMDGSLIGNKVGCAIVTAQTNIKIRLAEPKTIFNAGLQTILEAVELMQRNKVVKKIICTDSLSNLIAQQNLVTEKKPKAAELKDLMAEEGNNLKFMWVPAHTGNEGNKEAVEVAKKSLEKEVETTHKVVKADWYGWTRKKCLKRDKGPSWNQGVKWLGESRKSVVTLVPKAFHGDNKWWYRGLG